MRNLIEYRCKAETLDDVQHRIGELEETISALDDNIAYAEQYALPQTVEHLCRSRNKLNLVKLELELHANKLEKELLEYEFDRAMTR